MVDVRRADPGFRRQVAIVLVAGIVVGALLIAGFERYRIPLRDWMLAESGAVAQRVGLVFLLLAAFLVAPLFALAAYLWSLGGRILRAREFPPPGLRVIRDTPVRTGELALSRGHLLRALALAFGIASFAFGFLLWRLALLLASRAA